MATDELTRERDERPLRADAARNRERILTAAGEVFAERGLDVTLDDIARHAGVGVGTVYRRFADKDQLIDALFDQRLDQITEIAEQAIADPDPFHGLEGFLTVVLEQQALDRGLRELAFAGHLGREHVARARAQVVPLIEQLVAQAQAAGQLRADLDALGRHDPAEDALQRDGPDGVGRSRAVAALPGDRARRAAARARDADPLPVPSLGPDQMADCMRAAHQQRPRR